jgi:predicted aldo/keto reductase-like oxidoreductase
MDKAGKTGYIYKKFSENKLMKNEKINRREFFKSAAGVGLAAAIASGSKFASAIDANKPAEPNKPVNQSFEPVPRRQFGRAKITVPIVSFGAMFDIIDNQILLHKCLQWGVNYWDTAAGYAGGNSEIGIGQFFAKNSQKRKEVFLVTKASGANDAASRTEKLQTSFKRMNTNYIDLYYGVHSMTDPAQLTDELKQWAADAKAKGLIKYFGFSTHQNMAACLMAASKCDWIDAIMLLYNFRVMQDPQLTAAIDACNKAGIALIAMKTQALRRTAENDASISKQFIEKGFTEGQAKIKTVLQDNRICSACVGMTNVSYLTLAVAAALDKTQLSQSDLQFMGNYAKETADSYCTGCNACAAAVPQMPYVSDVMRSLMYRNSYGNKALAKEVFADVARKVNCSIGSVDYTAAEAVCPNGIQIGKIMTEAEQLLA